MYEVSIELTFSAAHSLRNYQGKCETLHGHNWKVEVVFEREDLDEVGMVIDFKKLKEKTRIIIDQFDHKYLNEIPPFQEINPSSENIACYIYKKLNRLLNSEKGNLKRVSVWESEDSRATYYE